MIIIIHHITGAPQINYETLIPLTIIYSLFLVIGILGNLATCIVILSNEYLRYKSIYRNVVTRKMYLAFRTLLSSSPHLMLLYNCIRNATNVYLTNLAIADIFTLVFSKYKIKDTKQLS